MGTGLPRAQRGSVEPAGSRRILPVDVRRLPARDLTDRLGPDSNARVANTKYHIWFEGHKNDYGVARLRAGQRTTGRSSTAASDTRSRPERRSCPRRWDLVPVTMCMIYKIYYRISAACACVAAVVVLVVFDQTGEHARGRSGSADSAGAQPGRHPAVWSDPTGVRGVRSDQVRCTSRDSAIMAAVAGSRDDVDGDGLDVG